MNGCLLTIQRYHGATVDKGEICYIRHTLTKYFFTFPSSTHFYSIIKKDLSAMKIPSFSFRLPSILFLLAGFLFLMGCDKEEKKDGSLIDDGYLRGADISFLPQAEEKGVVFFNKDYQPMNALRILKASGVNTIRLRVWHQPTDGHSGFEEVKAFAMRIQAEGMKVWLSLHYSDTWADPGAQIVPSAWSNKPFLELQDSLYQYTRKIVREIKPDIIQIGNEINNGMLLPQGSRWNNQSQFLSLVNKGIEAVRAEDPTCKIMLQFAGTNGVSSFYDLFKNSDYDQIGISYYPIWHGKDIESLEGLQRDLKNTFQKEVIIAETAYPFTLGWNDNTNNIVGLESQLILPDYPATPQGQQKFLERLIAINKNSGGNGVCYWGATWVAFKGPQATDGSSWENQALFDFSNRVLPAAEAFKN